MLYKYYLEKNEYIGELIMNGVNPSIGIRETNEFFHLASDCRWIKSGWYIGSLAGCVVRGRRN